MLSAFISSLRTVDLRRKILFTLGIVVLYRVGASLPSPGVNYPNVQKCIAQVSGGDAAQVYSLINLFSGGALLQLTVFAVGIMPYITASIIVQLLTVVIPRFEELRKEGQSGQVKMTQYTRYLTIALAILQSTSIVALAANGGLLQGCNLDIISDQSIFTLVVIVFVMTAGAALVMWMGEMITERGIGNGMSLLIFAGIAARIPSQGKNILDSGGAVTFVAVCVAALLIVVGVVFVEQGQRRIPVQYAKRMVGRRMYGGTSTYLPLKVNQAGVIPVIFASSLIYIPRLVTQLIRSGTGGVGNSWWDKFVANYLSNPASPVYASVYFGLIIFFTYFYVSITFNPDERADEMKKFGGFVPGIRPGKPTADYLRYVLSRITLPGSIYLGLIASLPILLMQDRECRVGAAAAVRWHRDTDRDRRRLRYGEADRKSAHAAQLRRVPQVRIVLLGPPGAGKGTQAAKLAEKLQIPHLSTGELFRENIGNGTKLGLKAKRYLDAGDLVPSELTNELVDDRLNNPDTAEGFILDGYPRSVPQAQALHDMLERRGTQLDAVVEFRVPEDELFERLKARGRADDTDDVIRNRMNVYRDETAPLIEYYSGELKTVDAVGTVDEVFARALRALGL